MAGDGSAPNALLAENERNEHPRAIANNLVGRMAGFFLASGFWRFVSRFRRDQRNSLISMSRIFEVSLRLTN